MYLFRFVFAVLLPATVRAAVNDAAAIYLSRMCTPLVSNTTWRGQFSANGLARALANSPFPCEYLSYMRAVCTANGTTPIDFLAEQQCLCNGDFFATTLACDACLFAHGDPRQVPEVASSRVSSLSVAECSPSPPYQPYSILLPPLNPTSLRNSPPLTLVLDQFPNNTEVSNYFTSTRSWTVGEITGSAVGRLTTWTNTDGVTFTPTSIPTSLTNITSRASSTIGTTTAVGGSSSTSASVSPTNSGSDATRREVKLGGGLIAAALGMMVLL